MAETPECICAPILEWAPHGFFGRIGGVSTGVVAGLNAGLGAGDDDAAVAENRRRVVEAVMPGADLLTPYQVHSADSVIVRTAWAQGDRPRADALVTDRPGLLLGIVTADCAPVLLADREAGVVGAAHAGWRGACDGVIAATIRAMAELGADPARIRAAIGPCIARGSYEVDDGFRAQFGPAGDRFFVNGRPGHHQFDLEAYVASRLTECGITQMQPLGLDTYADDARFFSYRRATHRGEATYGRQISIIGLPN